MTENDIPRGACVQITPCYPPMISGVGDYAAVLSEQVAHLGGNLYTVVAGKDRIIPPISAKNVIFTDRQGLAKVLQPAATVLLHFSGYGYQQHGLCDWLVDVVQDWRSGPEQRRLVTMFHEVYASGPIWRRSYWTSGGQRRIASRLAHLSDACLVSSHGGRDRLREIAPTMPTELLPIFSNVGEVQHPLSLQDRDPVAVVFGTVGRRKGVYDALRRLGSNGYEHLRALGIHKIIDIGAGDAVGEPSFSMELARLGRLDAKDLTAVLASSRFGLLDYPDLAICKSGVLAAYLAHGMLAVNTRRFQAHMNEPLLGTAYLELTDRADTQRQQKIASYGHDWYQGHTVSETARRIFSILYSQGPQ